MIQRSAIVAYTFAIEDSTTFPPLDMVRFCFVHLQLYEDWVAQHPSQVSYGRDLSPALPQDEVPTIIPNAIEWPSLWSLTAAAIRHYFYEQMWTASWDSSFSQELFAPRLLMPDALYSRDCQLAGACLTLIDSLSGTTNDRVNPIPGHNPTFPDDLVAALGLFIAEDEVSKYARLSKMPQLAKTKPTVEPPCEDGRGDERPPGPAQGAVGHSVRPSPYASSGVQPAVAQFPGYSGMVPPWTSATYYPSPYGGYTGGPAIAPPSAYSAGADWNTATQIPGSHGTTGAPPIAWEHGGGTGWSPAAHSSGYPGVMGGTQMSGYNSPVPAQTFVSPGPGVPVDGTAPALPQLVQQAGHMSQAAATPQPVYRPEDPPTVQGSAVQGADSTGHGISTDNGIDDNFTPPPPSPREPSAY